MQKTQTYLIFYASSNNFVGNCAVKNNQISMSFTTNSARQFIFPTQCSYKLILSIETDETLKDNTRYISNDAPSIVVFF